MNDSAAPSASIASDLVTQVQSMLMEEYKIIQGKIDRIGEDKFKIRSWSFTLLTGGVAAAKFTGALENSYSGPFLILLFIPAVWAFQLVENRQRQIGKRLGLRAAAIENEWRRFFRIRSGSDLGTPRLANDFIREGRRERQDKHGWIARFRRTAYADEVFYYIQYMLIVLSVAALLIDKGFRATASPSPNTFVIRYGTNEIRISAEQTNYFVTNLIETVRFTTNSVIVTDFITDSVLHSSSTTNSAAGGNGK